MSHKLFTIGHSNHSNEEFLSLLHKHRITAVGDVRSVPYSRFNPQFNREAIEKSLKKEGIGYVFLGKELGARPDDRSCYTENQVDFSLLEKKKFFVDGIYRIINGLENGQRIALMCSEKEPLFCHRAVLICRHLKQYDLEIDHILYDGHLESHHDTEARLMKSTKTEPTLFDRNTDVLINSAYDIQSEKISFAGEGV